ncbi:hypothetical protein MNBD_ALPHA09-202 [hydrothermal vent metagenome]|uniref:DUF5753 domain-containing protein n=1 Tax=hydrothermal vent metagenome TaxID=652676 RepID=A0A3B0TSH7_9ZZZZ
MIRKTSCNHKKVNVPEGRQQISTAMQIESARQADGSTPLHQWHKEAAGYKLRYVPSTLPDMLCLSMAPEQAGSLADIKDGARGGVRGGGVENVLDGVTLADMDVEIAMPVQTLQDLAAQTGLWRNASPKGCRRQLELMALTCEAAYPALRLHLYDGSQTYSAPYTVFGKARAAIYIGDAYLVVTAVDQVQAFVRHFDELVRQTVFSPDAVHETLTYFASKTAK